MVPSARLVFIHGDPPAPGEEFVRPTMSTLGALRTENGTRGWFGANLGTGGTAACARSPRSATST